MTHIEALEECIKNSTISSQAKVHLIALRDRLVEQQKNRSPTAKGRLNEKIRDVLTTEVQMNTDYTTQELCDIVSAKGFSISDKSVIGNAITIGMRKTGTDGVSSIYRRF